MPPTPTLGNGKICYVEIPTADLARSMAFYSSVFGWTVRRRGDGHMALRMPVTDSAALKDAIAAVDKRHSRLDLLVNSGSLASCRMAISMRWTTRSSATSSMSTSAA